MQVRAKTSEAFIQKALLDLMVRVRGIEHNVANIAVGKCPEVEAVLDLVDKLDLLRLPEHAALTAALGGVECKVIGQLLRCSPGTAKRYLDAALAVFGVRDRKALQRGHSSLLDAIPDGRYEQRYGIGKRWWIENDRERIDRLASKAGNASD